MSELRVNIIGWATLLLLLAGYLVYAARVMRRSSADAMARVMNRAYKAGVKAGRREVTEASEEDVAAFLAEEEALDKAYRRRLAHETCSFCKGSLPEWECDLLRRTHGEEQT